jgi:N6-L-threonylcarbamoyladenine synthase
MIKKVLAIETSCDDTSAAVVSMNGCVDSVVSANQDIVHQPFGGIVPEIASRNHALHLLPLVDSALEKAKLTWTDIDGIAVTARPGLVGSLLVGVVTAKSLAMIKNLPWIGVNHLEAHLLAPFLRDDEFSPPKDFSYPYVALAVSGGHTQIYEVSGIGDYTVLGRTVDDAAGEAFDKFAKMLGLGFPGGPKIDKLASTGKVTVDFPRPFIHEKNLNFSFSGLKTAGLRLLESMTPEQIQANMNDLCASYQEAIIDVLIKKLARAIEETGHSRAVLTGGVSANSGLRARAESWAKDQGIELVVPPLRYCTDNAAMVGYAGILRLNKGERSEQDLKPLAESLPNDFKRLS